ncbi:unnamed protein product [Plutella xylostella]|uniref:(diamondback moth) hypothetical protein n=1 Tax=Plutella xylostella TaxID=51655 RepID=A0A8S4G226_PLUXY|nr:unnamed protein product [Plutella xylostella]
MMWCYVGLLGLLATAHALLLLEGPNVCTRQIPRITRDHFRST